ncbi:MAG: hypothetical protein QOJ13_2803 [Gaiellales bacterium]|jgi:hypothetical protein|nr:hypothetical protein [Gaiellales bacterium]
MIAAPQADKPVSMEALGTFLKLLAHDARRRARRAETHSPVFMFDLEGEDTGEDTPTHTLLDASTSTEYREA